jgi:hypothetical protein
MVVATPADLLALAKAESLLHPFRKPPLRLRFASMAADETAAWQARLDHYAGQCGCAEATVGIAAYILASVICMVTLASRGGHSLAFQVGPFLAYACVFCAGLVASALVGKLIGLAIAARGFERACRALASRLGEPEAVLFATAS